MFFLSKFTEENAKTVCSWKYEQEYSVYNFPEWETVKEQRWDIADAVNRKAAYFAVLDENSEFCGYFLFRFHQNIVTLGLGIRPELCGKGHGAEFLALILNEFRARYPEQTLELEVRSFNKRAIRCYRHAGFQDVKSYFKETPMGADTFLQMRLADNK